MFLTMESARLAVLYHFFEITFKSSRRISSNSFRPVDLVECGIFEHFGHSSMSSADSAGEVIDEIERVLDLVCNSGGELAEGSQFLGLN